MSASWGRRTVGVIDPDAYRDAVCVRWDPHNNLWDPRDHYEPARAVLKRHRQAAALCRTCPAFTTCDTERQGLGNPDGVWAAVIPEGSL